MNIKIGLYEGTVFNLEMKNDFIVIKNWTDAFCMYYYGVFIDIIVYMTPLTK